MISLRTQVGIVGVGPAGLTLALLLHAVGAGDRLAREGLDHTGVYVRFRERVFHVGMLRLTGRKITIYVQQEVVKDEIAALIGRGIRLHFEVDDVAVHELEGERPRITYVHDDEERELECGFLAGCDGFHGVCRPSIPAGAVTEHVIYARHERGLALHSMRSPTVSRLYLQVAEDEPLEEWPDERVWDEPRVRIGEVNEGPIFDKGITPMRSFVCEPMLHGRRYEDGASAPASKTSSCGYRPMASCRRRPRALAGVMDYPGMGTPSRSRALPS